ncbi:MAG: Ku domain-containing protein [Firmicutes bacterium]|nr:Ku domain-containing protein [Bacillota bacterium]
MTPLRDLFKGVLGFGLVSIPVEVYKAVEDEHIPLHWIHRPCGTRIRYRKYCPTCDSLVPDTEVARAAETENGGLVVLEEPEPGARSGGEAPAIAILGFHGLEEIDPVLYRAAYWLKPGKGGLKAYRLLGEVMRASGRVAMAELERRGHRQLALVRPYPRSAALLLHTLYAPASLRREGEAFGGEPVALTRQELTVATSLVKAMSRPFRPEAYPNREREALLARIRAAAPAAGPPAAGAAEELLAQLRASVREAREEARPARRRA